MKLDLSNMPKLHSPFLRKEINGQYVCIPEIDPEYRWVFEDSIAVEKLDGTNISIEIKNHEVHKIKNRENIINLWEKGSKRFVEAVLNSIERDYFKPKALADGIYFGELIGPQLQGNPYKMNEHIFIPFSKAIEGYTYKFWESQIGELKGKSDEEIFSKMSDIFKGLWSLLKRKTFNKDPDVTEDSVFDSTNLSSEGIIFYSKDLKKMSKLRRDMFDWYKGRRHGEKA